MFIQPLNGYKFTSEVKKTSSKKTNSDFTNMVADEASDISDVVADAPVQGAPPVSNFDLIMLQEQETQKELRKDNRQKANQMLGYLSKIQRSLIEQQPVDIEDVKLHRSRSDDDVLEQLVDEIELRAAIENAKLKKQLDAQDKK